MLGSAPVVLFMKGSPTAPKCKYSAKVVNLLGDTPFQSFDILEDDAVKEQLVIHSKWKTFP